MPDLLFTFVLLIPLWILVGYVFTRGQVKSRTKWGLFLFLIYSFVIFPVVYSGTYYLYDSFYLWQDYHCQSSYGLGVPDGWCLNPYSLYSSRLSDDILFPIRFVIAFISQVLFLSYLDKRKLR